MVHRVDRVGGRRGREIRPYSLKELLDCRRRHWHVVLSLVHLRECHRVVRLRQRREWRLETLVLHAVLKLRVHLQETVDEC